MARWTSEEVSELELLLNCGYSIEKIAKKLNKTESAIKGKMNKLGLHQKGSRTHWTEKDLISFRNDWLDDTMTVERIAKKYDRNINQIYAKASQMGFGKRGIGLEHLTITELADVMGVNRKTVERWIYKHGLKTIKNKLGGAKFVVTLEDLESWLKENQNRFDATKIDEYLFYNEPKWLTEKRIKDSNGAKVKTFKIWTEEEEYRLKSLLKLGKNLDYIAKELGRTKISIQRRMDKYEIGSCRQYDKPWTFNEEKIVIDNYNKIPFEELVKLLPKRTETAIKGKIAILKNNGIIERDKELRVTRHFTEEENRIIIAEYKNKSLAELAVMLNRSESSLGHQITKLRREGKLTEQKINKTYAIRKWTSEEDAIIIQNHGIKNHKEISELLFERTKNAVDKRVIDLKKLGKL